MTLIQQYFLLHWPILAGRLSDPMPRPVAQVYSCWTEAGKLAVLP